MIELNICYLKDFDLPDITNECYNESELDASSDDGRLIFSTFKI